jgi:hypothetical protein
MEVFIIQPRRLIFQYKGVRQPEDKDRRVREIVARGERKGESTQGDLIKRSLIGPYAVSEHSNRRVR